jgi:hypothetical protein
VRASPTRFLQNGEDAESARTTQVAHSEPPEPRYSRSSSEEEERHRKVSTRDEKNRKTESRPPQANPTRGTATSYAAPTAAAAPVHAGRAPVVVNGPPPAGRVVYVNVNEPKATPNATTAPMMRDKDGRVLCFRCGEPITTKVCEWERKPYDAVCFRIAQVAGSDALKMPNTAMAEPPPVRTYRNRKGEAELAEIAKQNAQYEKKHNKLANQNKAKLEKAKEQRAKELARQQAKQANK